MLSVAVHDAGASDSNVASDHWVRAHEIQNLVSPLLDEREQVQIHQKYPQREADRA